MLVTFLSLIIGAFLLGCAPIFIIIMIITVIMGSYNMYTAFRRTSFDRIGNLTKQIPTTQRPLSKTIQA